MKNYDEQYYFLQSVDDDSHPGLTADINTEDRRYSFEAQPMGSPPLVFFNGVKEYQERLKIKIIEMPPKILFDGSNLMVPGKVREKLLRLDIPHLDMHPAIYIHDDGKWYEDYWYMTFTERFDCWDRTSSVYEEEPLEMGALSCTVSIRIVSIRNFSPEYHLCGACFSKWEERKMHTLFVMKAFLAYFILVILADQN